MVAFRGSEAPTTLDGLKDWLLTNANNYLILPEGRIGTDFAAAGVGARFHRGFMDALEMIWEPLLAAVNEAQKAKERPLWVTGHSLGGALALLAAWRLQRNFVAVQEIVTFGAPMIGNEAAAQAFEQEFPGKIFRYVDLEDVVPHLPGEPDRQRLQPLPERGGPRRRRGRRGPGRPGCPGAGGRRRPARGPLDPAQADQVWEMVKGRIASHMIGNYQAGSRPGARSRPERRSAGKAGPYAEVAARRGRSRARDSLRIRGFAPAGGHSCQGRTDHVGM